MNPRLGKCRQRDEPTVESELMNFCRISPTAGSARALKPADVRGRVASASVLSAVNRAEQTAELSIDDLGLDLRSPGRQLKRPRSTFRGSRSH